ncbi:MAG: hypothetical protein M3198_19695 [Actinomycetota bacterium]|nr:hypothetical protein [Actinomycetota bacterium]
MPKVMQFRAVKRAVVLLALTSLLLGISALPAQAHKMPQKPGDVHCDKFNMKNLTGDTVIENPEVKMYDDKGNLLAAKVVVAVVVDADLIVCVEVDAEADINIVLEAVLDEDKNGKKDTVVVRVDIDAKADVNVKVAAKIRGKIGLTVAVAVEVNANVAVKAGEKKSMKCKGKDGVDTY